MWDKSKLAILQREAEIAVHMHDSIKKLLPKRARTVVGRTDEST